jgi:Ca2+-binding RTX toxin-like protein
VAITVTNVNEAPIVSNAIAPQGVTVGSIFSYTFGSSTFTDPEGSALTYSASALPTGILFNASTRTFSGTPTVVGTNTITVSASDGVNITNSNFSLIVTAPVVTTTVLDQSGATSGQIITGTPNPDSIFGSNFNDTIRAGDSDDTIFGNGGNDRLYGDGGDDILVGGNGIDNLYGGLGSDRFVLQPSVFGLDIVNDFQDGIDRIDLSTADSGGLTFGSLTFTAFGATGTSTSIRTGGVEIMRLINVNTSLINETDFISSIPPD